MLVYLHKVQNRWLYMAEVLYRTVYTKSLLVLYMGCCVCHVFLIP